MVSGYKMGRENAGARQGTCDIWQARLFQRQGPDGAPRDGIIHPEACNSKRATLTLQPAYNSTEKLKQFTLDSKGLQKLIAALLEQHAKGYSRKFTRVPFK
jgi:hypothetical protein